MYLHMLEKDEKVTFLSFAKHLAQIDDSTIDASERYTLQYMCAEMGLEDREIPAFDEANLLNVFHRDKARRILVLEGVGIAYSNGEMSGEQRQQLDELCKRFSLPGDFLGRAEAIVKRQIGVMQEFDALIG